MLLEKIYEGFDFTAPRFIQVIIRKQRLHRACWVRLNARTDEPWIALRGSAATEREPANPAD